MIKKLCIVGGAVLFLTIAGCGYTTRSAISNKYKTIYITPFVNKIDITREADVGSKYKIYRPHLETDVTTAVINKFLWDGNLKPVDAENADVTLNSELTEFRKDPLRYDENDNVLEYRVNIIVNLSFVNNKTKEMIWQENGFTGFVSYFTSGSAATSEAQAINNAITDLARRIVARAVEEW